MAVNVRFQNYAFPVFTEDVKWQRNAKGQIINGHAVALVGWDEDKDNGDGTRGAWLLRNSWGTKWGGNDNEIGAGYLWVKYGVSYIGSYAAWIEPTGST
jgi:C1A family cysteine protease